MRGGEPIRTLWIEASPKGDAGLSSQLALAYLKGQDYERFSVWDDDMLRFGRDAAIAKFAPLFGETVTDEQQAIWQQVLDEIERVRGFDRLVLSTPMWNWHVPHALKAWIDIIVLPIAGFTINEKGEHVGMLGYRVDTLVIEPTTRWTPGECEQMRSEAITLAGAAGRLFS